MIPPSPIFLPHLSGANIASRENRGIKRVTDAVGDGWESLCPNRRGRFGRIWRTNFPRWRSNRSLERIAI